MEFRGGPVILMDHLMHSLVEEPLTLQRLDLFRRME
jgi:hypothetical protein